MNDQNPASAPVLPARGRERGIDRVLTLFAYLNSCGRPVRVAELPKALGAPRSTIYEIVRSLAETGMLEFSGADDNKVFFGRTVYHYGISYFRENELIRRASAEVEALAIVTGETSELCMRNGNHYTIIHTHPGKRMRWIGPQVGAQFPLPWTASGRLLLSHLSPTEIRDLISPEDLVLPDRSVVDVEDFIQQCGAARGKDVIVTRGLVNNYSQCLATPIVDADGLVQATICLVLPIDVTDAERAVLQDQLIASGRKLSMHA
ncbi:MAG: IclR family transcriptional regulator [Paracoccaceae bacterium]